MKFRFCQNEILFPRPVMVMGILNVTPDSFSDGGKFLDPEAAVSHALALVEQGAEILDIGGESSRPNAAPVSETEELRRVMPVLEQLQGRVGVPISIDTMKVEVARAALRCGASIVNDVGASRREPAMWRLVAETGAGYICMHMQGTPATMQADPRYVDVVREVGEFFAERLIQMRGCGMDVEQIILDPGIGFGKTLRHNLQLLRGLRSFSRLERPLLLGVSRKSFLGKVPFGETAGRLPGALACACLAVESGVQIIRAHDVPETLAAVRATESILAESV